MIVVLVSLIAALGVLVAWRARRREVAMNEHDDGRHRGGSDTVAIDVRGSWGAPSDAAMTEAPTSVAVGAPTSVVQEMYHQPSPSIADIATGVFVGLWLFVLSAAAISFVAFVGVLFILQQR